MKIKYFLIIFSLSLNLNVFGAEVNSNVDQNAENLDQLKSELAVKMFCFGFVFQKMSLKASGKIKTDPGLKKMVLESISKEFTPDEIKELHKNCCANLNIYKIQDSMNSDPLIIRFFKLIDQVAEILSSKA